MLCTNCGSQFSDFMPVCPKCGRSLAGKDFGVRSSGIIYQNQPAGGGAGEAPGPAKLLPQTPTPEPSRPLPKPFVPIELPEEKPKIYPPVSPPPKVLIAEKPTPSAMPLPKRPSEKPMPVVPKVPAPAEAKPQPFVPRKRNWLLAGLIFASIFLIFVIGGIWALDEFVPGFLPIRLYDLIVTNQRVTDFLPPNTAGFYSVKVSGEARQVKQASSHLSKLPGGSKIEEGLADILRSKDLEDFLGISFKDDVLPALAEEIYLANFSFKVGPEADLVLAVEIKDSTKFFSAISKMQQKAGAKITEQEKLGVKYYLVDISSAGRTGQILGTTYQFQLGNYWFVSTNQRNAEEIFRVRNSQKLSSLIFGKALGLSSNPRFGEVWKFFEAQEKIALAYLSGQRLFEAGIPQFGGLDRMLELATENSALGVALSAEESGFRIAYRYFSGDGKKLTASNFDPASNLAKYVPQSLLGGPIIAYYEAGALSKEIENLEKSFKNISELYQTIDEWLGVNFKNEFLPLVGGGWAAFAAVPESAANPELGAVIQLSDPAKTDELLEKIRQNSKAKWRKAKGNGMTIYFAKPPEFQGMAVAAAVVGDRLLLCSSLRGIRELIGFETKGLAPLSEDEAFKSSFAKTERKVHAGTYISPTGVYALLKLYLGRYLSADADVILSAFAKTIKTIDYVNFAEDSRAGGESFWLIEELPAEEKQKADEAFERIIKEVTPAP